MEGRNPFVADRYVLCKVKTNYIRTMSLSRVFKFIRPTSVHQRFEGKIFCIGFNKTGTTSIKQAFIDLGFRVGDQRTAELMIRSYSQGDYGPLIDYCRGAQVFQDIPFSRPDVYKVLDAAFPGSKFILTVRDSPEVWFRSLLNFHSRIFGRGKTPTAEDLQNAEYVWKGWAWECMSNLPLTDPDNYPYDPKDHIRRYTKHNEDVRSYFKERPMDLLKINLKDKDAWGRFCTFIGIEPPPGDFPWENKTEDIPIGGWKNPVS